MSTEEVLEAAIRDEVERLGYCLRVKHHEGQLVAEVVYPDGSGVALGVFGQSRHQALARLSATLASSNLEPAQADV